MIGSRGAIFQLTLSVESGCRSDLGQALGSRKNGQDRRAYSVALVRPC